VFDVADPDRAVVFAGADGKPRSIRREARGVVVRRRHLERPHRASGVDDREALVRSALGVVMNVDQSAVLRDVERGIDAPDVIRDRLRMTGHLQRA